MDLLEDLFRHRVVIVTGKGGTGKTSLAIALGQEAARRGKRTAIAETYGARRVPVVFGRTNRGYEEQTVRTGLSTLSLSAESCTRDFLLKQIHFEGLYRIVFRNRIMAPFMDAVPGLTDVIQLGKVFDMVQEEDHGRPRLDLIIVDAPATGHGLSLVFSPQAMMDMTMAGPFHANAEKVWSLFSDPARTALVLVTVPEFLPIRETLELHTRLRVFHSQIAFCALNRTLPVPFPVDVDWQMARERLLADASPRLTEAVHLSDRWNRRTQYEAVAWKELSDTIRRPVVPIPWRATNQPSAEELDFFRDGVPT